MLVHSSHPCQRCQTPPRFLMAGLTKIYILIFNYKWTSLTGKTAHVKGLLNPKLQHTILLQME